MKAKRLLSFLMPKKVSIGVDNVEEPNYTVSIEGGAFMGKKNELIKKETSTADAVITTAGELSTTIKAVISEPETTQREEFKELSSIAQIDGISPEDRAAALAAINKSMDYRQARFMTKEENRQQRFMTCQDTIIRLAPYITVAILGVVTLSTGVACYKIYNTKKAA